MNSKSIGISVSYETWLAALASSACIGFTSLVPWLFNMTFFEQHKTSYQGSDESKSPDGRMKYLLSFAIGAILGDIFFHLIPESYQSFLFELNHTQKAAHERVGLSILAGIFVFIIIEMILEKWSKSNDNKQGVTNSSQTNHQSISEQKLFNRDLKQNRVNIDESSNVHNDTLRNFNCRAKQKISQDFINNNNNNNSTCMPDQNLKNRTQVVDHGESSNTNFNFTEADCDTQELKTIDEVCKKVSLNHSSNSDTIAGYLNLIANGFDNFTHGLAIGASFLVGFKVGILTTFVIFIHEIPHEICDYAILVNSGFTRLDAVKAQSLVSLLGILGTATALYVRSNETLTAKTIFILPFSAGGFLYIALVNLLPEVLDQQTDIRNTSGQIICVILGMAFMASVAII